MDILTTQEASGIDISTEYEVLSWTAPETLLVIAQVLLTGLTGSTYGIHVYIDGALVIPDRDIGSHDLASIIAQSRSLVVKAGATLTIGILGSITDTAIDAVTTVIDATPISATAVTEQLIPAVLEA